MKPHPRLRRAALVSGAVVSVLLVAVWIASASWGVWNDYPDGSWSTIGVSPGCAIWARRWEVALGGLAKLDRLQVMVNSLEDLLFTKQRFQWWFVWRRSPGLHVVVVPLWFPAALSLLGTAAVWRLDARARRRARVGKCAKCGYDRAGLAPDAKCPECGGGPPAVNHYPKEGEAPSSGPPSPG